MLDLVGLAARDELAKMGDDVARPMQLRRGFIEGFVDRRLRRLGPSAEEVAGGEEIVRGRRERLVDLVRQRGRHVGQGIETVAMKAAQPRLEPAPLAEVAEEPDKELFPAVPGLGHLDFDGKLQVVLAPRFELAPDADDLRFARPHTALDVAVMQRVMRLRNERVDVAPDQFLRGIAEHRGRRRIDRLDDPVLVDRDDRIDHSVDDRSGARFAVAQRLVRAPPVADVDECDDEALDFVFDRAVGLHPHQAPAALEAQHLALVRT